MKHTYGVHYDMDDRGHGHPVFHAQIRPMQEFVEEVRKQFNLRAKADGLNGAWLRNVWTPTAQMDFMSVPTQLCADHLLDGNRVHITDQVLNAFGDVRSACNFLLGTAHGLSYLNSGRAPQCYRSTHWYGD